MKVILCGSPHTGKSCLRYGIKEAIKTIKTAPYPYVITACPDGEGSWYQETVGKYSELASDLKKRYKGKFTAAFTIRTASWVKNSSVPITIIDIGGIIDDKNEKICKDATHAIILYKNDSNLQEWRDFCNKLNIKIIAEIYSDYYGKEDKKPQLEKDGVYRGSIHYLERGDLTVKDRPTIIELANILANMTEQKERETMGTYQIDVENGDTLIVKFGTSAENNIIVQDVEKRLNELIKNGQIAKGEIIKINGPTSIHIAMTLSYKLSQMYQAIAYFDPKLSKYVVTVADGQKYKIGDLID